MRLPPPLLRRAHLLAAAAGMTLGLIDLGLLLAAGAHIDLAGEDITAPVMLCYGGTFAALGYAIGRLTQARARARDDAARLVQAEKLAGLGRMAAGVAHEVRNPLGVIRSSAALVEEGLPEGDPDLARACRFIQEEVDRLDSFVRDILVFARPLTPAPEQIALRPALARAMTLAGGALAETEGEIAAADETLRADPDLLVQVVMGLLINAGEAGGERVALRVAREGADCVLEVADDGPGVDASDAPRLFEPFFTTKAQGTGLGLAMASRIAQAHGGSLELAPGRGAGPGGRGACLRLRLPQGGGTQ